MGTFAVRSALSKVEEQDVAQGVTRARRLLDRQAGIRSATAREYAWWTDTWDYIDAPHTAAAADFIEDNFVGWLPVQYGDEFISIWSRDRQRVFLWSDSSARGVEAAFERPERFDLVAREKSAGGFVATPRGLFLAGVSVVVRTNDPNAAGPQNGYVAFARPVSDTLLGEWSASLQERLVLLPLTGDSSLVGDTAVSRRTASGDSIETLFAVRGIYGEVVAVAVLTTSRVFLSGLQRSTLGFVLAAALVGLAVIALVWLLGVRTLVRPLESISMGLSRMRADGRLSALGAPANALEWSVFVGTFNETVAALHASEERYRTLFEQSADALLVVHADHQAIEDVNPAAERLAGCAREALIGRPLGEFLAADGEGAGSSPPLRWRRRDGTSAPVEVLTSDVDGSSHRLTLISVRDLTARQAIEEHLRQSQKMDVLGRLAGGIAHDFNNLLGAVLLSAGGLRGEIRQGNAAEGSIQTIERAARRAAELTRQLLTFARREGVRREPVSVQDLVAGVRRLCLRTFASGQAVKIVVESSADDLAVLGDADQLEQALLNLSLNARDAMPDGGTLTIRTSVEDVRDGTVRKVHGLAPGRYVVLSVQDTGVGITEDVRAHLFEPFFTTKARGKGSGFGLAATYGIVLSHGGAITVHSEVGRGSRFDVILPLTTLAQPKPRPGVGSPTGGSETILLVDDEDDLRRALSRAMTRLGYTVIQASNGREGVALFAERPDDIRLVLLDVLMPEMGGVEAFGALRAIRPGVLVLAISGHASGEEIRQLVQEGVQGVLAKPFGVVELAASVRAILDRAAADA